MADNTIYLNRKGRKAGSLNRETIERTEALREWLLKKDATYKILNVLFNRMDANPDAIKVADLIKCFQMVQPFMFYTISEQETAARLEQIMNLDNPEEMKSNIIDFVNALKVANG